MTLEAINQEIERKQAELAAAQTAADAAVEQLAQDPGAIDKQDAARLAQQAQALVQQGMDALTAAQTVAMRYAWADNQRGRQAETLALFNQAKALIAQRVSIASTIDTALRGLTKALAAWDSLNYEASRAAQTFHQRVYGIYNPAYGGMDSTILNAIADQICEGVHGLTGSHNYFTFNHTRHVAGVPESCEKDAAQSSERYLAALKSVAQAKEVV